MLVHTRYSINVSGLAIANYFLSKTEIFEKKKKADGRFNDRFESAVSVRSLTQFISECIMQITLQPPHARVRPS